MKKKLYNSGTSQNVPYEPPQVRATVMTLEYSIAASSAVVTTPSATDLVLDEWDTGIDRDTDTDWN